MLILPGTPLFDETIALSWQFLEGQKPSQYYVKGSDGVVRQATYEEVNEYLRGGEYEEVERMELLV